MKFVAARDNLQMRDGARVEAGVGIGSIPDGFGIEVELTILLERLIPTGSSSSA